MLSDSSLYSGTMEVPGTGVTFLVFNCIDQKQENSLKINSQKTFSDLPTLGQIGFQVGKKREEPKAVLLNCLRNVCYEWQCWQGGHTTSVSASLNLTAYYLPEEFNDF